MTDGLRRSTDQWDRVLSKYGAVTVIALFLVWWLRSDVSGAIHGIQSALNVHIQETNFYLRQICLNTAVTPQAVAGCQPPVTK